jgi:ectoine hydroxylase-related dioxygenase (phytanoyl-CoA dioxygenase family)
VRLTTTTKEGISWLERYREDGYVVVEDAFDATTLTEILADATKVCRGEYGQVQGAEPGPPGESVDDLLSRFLCIHMPHKISPVMREALRAERLVDVLTTVIGPNVKSMQSMLFIKPPGMPGQAWHQDEFFIPTRDRSLTAAWVALDDATVGNGGLWVIPGSHRSGVIWPLKPHDDPRFDSTPEAQGFPFSEDDAVAVELPAGAAVVFNGYLLHRSLPNQSAHSLRRALANHYMSAESVLPWRVPEGWDDEMGILDYRDIVLVAGEDPYAYNPVQDLSSPHVRRLR